MITLPDGGLEDAMIVKGTTSALKKKNVFYFIYYWSVWILLTRSKIIDPFLHFIFLFILHIFKIWLTKFFKMYSYNYEIVNL